MYAANRTRRRGYSLVEVLVALVVLVIGVVGIMRVFPPMLRASSEAALKGRAALLAEAKVQELRRDDNQGADTITAIAALVDPTTPIPFAEDDRLAYQFHSRSLLNPTDTTTSVDDDYDVARVIVRFNPAFRPSGEILYELRFQPGY